MNPRNSHKATPQLCSPQAVPPKELCLSFPSNLKHLSTSVFPQHWTSFTWYLFYFSPCCSDSWISHHPYWTLNSWNYRPGVFHVCVSYSAYHIIWHTKGIDKSEMNEKIKTVHQFCWITGMMEGFSFQVSLFKPYTILYFLRNCHVIEEQRMTPWPRTEKGKNLSSFYPRWK